MVVLALLATGLSGTPAAAAEQSLLATFPPVAQVHPEAGTPAPRLEGADWILSPGTHFLPGDYVQTGRSLLIFQTDGNLVVYVRRGDPFASRTCCRTNLVFKIYGFGVISIERADFGTVLWYQLV